LVRFPRQQEEHHLVAVVQVDHQEQANWKGLESEKPTAWWWKNSGEKNSPVGCLVGI